MHKDLLGLEGAHSPQGQKCRSDFTSVEAQAPRSEGLLKRR